MLQPRVAQLPHQPTNPAPATIVFLGPGKQSQAAPRAQVLRHQDPGISNSNDNDICTSCLYWVNGAPRIVVVFFFGVGCGGNLGRALGEFIQWIHSSGNQPTYLSGDLRALSTYYFTRGRLLIQQSWKSPERTLRVNLVVVLYNKTTTAINGRSIFPSTRSCQPRVPGLVFHPSAFEIPFRYQHRGTPAEDIPG